MAETIESFVTKLQTEGIEAGQAAAEKLRAEAAQQAEQIVAEAQQQAEKCLADAQKQAENLLARSKTELELAARDVMLRLKSSLNKALEAIIAGEIKETLPQSDFISNTLHDLVLAYAAADIEHSGRMKINVSPKLQEQLADWALDLMHKHANEAGMAIDLKGTLKASGFEYTVTGATVEVTLESVTETICELVSPRLRKVIDQAVSNQKGAEKSATSDQSE